MMKKIDQQKGFTLIELLTVVAIMGILSGIVLQSIKNYRERTYDTVRFAHIDQLEKALQIYLTKAGDGAKFPTSTNFWDCIGLNAVDGFCWGPSNNIRTEGNTVATNINLALEGNISEIPKDPLYAAGGAGDYYLYVSGTIAPQAQFPQGSGAYIHWLSADKGPTTCGRGYIAVDWGSNVRCGLFLGNN